MNITGPNVLSVVLAVTLHVVVVVLLLVQWEEPIKHTVTEVKPYYIDAAMVASNPHREKARAQARDAEERATRQAEKQRQAQVEKEQAAQVNRQRINEEMAARAEAERKQKEAEQRALDKKVVKSVVAVDPATELEQQKMEQSLQLAIIEEQEFIRAVTDDEKAMAYVAQIQREIVQNWSRPPSARNGMQALLRVFLVPTGEVVNVTVEESSGNESFDRSAVLAVRKAERFQVPTDPRQFERNFREFEVLFRPDDLRL